MIITKDKIYLLLKTHIDYISIIILIIGLNMKYSLPSLFPFLKIIDINFFGTILIEFSLLILIGNWFIDRYKEEVNKILFSKILDQKLGLKGGVPLITELVNIIQPFAYNVIYHHIENHIKKTNSKKEKYDIIQKIIIKLSPKQDNVHYRFGVGTTEKNEPILNYIKLNGKQLSLKKDIRPIETIEMDNSIKDSFQILTPLKKGKVYEVEIETIFPECMNDLKKEKEEFDFHEYCYYALTERTFLKHKYDFSNFTDYEFKAEKRYLNLPDIEDIECKINKKNKEVIIEAGNLKNGDRIYVTYTKKK